MRTKGSSRDDVSALAFAQCIRTHGFPQFPDPIATAQDPGQGYFTLGRGMYFPQNSPTEFGSAAFVHAAKACGVQLPDLPPPRP